MEDSELTYIRIPYPKEKDLRFDILAPASPLAIAPGIGTAWATGKYHDPKFVIPLNMHQSGGAAGITVVGAFAYRTPPQYLPVLTLSFGRKRPFSLNITGGEISNHLDLGGVPLLALEIRYGGSVRQEIDFSFANPQKMKRFRCNADHGPVLIGHLANANAEDVRLGGEATHFQIDLGGELARSLTLRLGMSVARVELTVAAGTAVKVLSNRPPTGGAADDFERNGKAFCNAAAREGKQPLLTVHNIASGSALSVTYA